MISQYFTARYPTRRASQPLPHFLERLDARDIRGSPDHPVPFCSTSNCQPDRLTHRIGRPRTRACASVVSRTCERGEPGGTAALLVRELSLLSVSVPSRAKPGLKKIGDGYLLNQEAVTLRFLTDNKQLPWQIERTWGLILKARLDSFSGLRCSILKPRLGRGASDFYLYINPPRA